MKKRIIKIFDLIHYGVCILVLTGIVLAGDASADGFAVVVNKSNDTESISFGDLVKYFSAEKPSWPNGKKVTIFLRETGSGEKKVLLEKVYKLTEDELRKMWTGKVYKGEIASPPKAINSPAALIKTVIDTEGGVGIVKAEELSGNVKALRIDGKLPSDADYPLK